MIDVKGFPAITSALVAEGCISVYVNTDVGINFSKLESLLDTGKRGNKQNAEAVAKLLELVNQAFSSAGGDKLHSELVRKRTEVYSDLSQFINAPDKANYLQSLGDDRYTELKEKISFFLYGKSPEAKTPYITQVTYGVKFNKNLDKVLDSLIKEASRGISYDALGGEIELNVTKSSISEINIYVVTDYVGKIFGRVAITPENFEKFIGGPKGFIYLQKLLYDLYKCGSIKKEERASSLISSSGDPVNYTLERFILEKKGINIRKLGSYAKKFFGYIFKGLKYTIPALIFGVAIDAFPPDIVWSGGRLLMDMNLTGIAAGAFGYGFSKSIIDDFNEWKSRRKNVQETWREVFNIVDALINYGVSKHTIEW